MKSRKVLLWIIWIGLTAIYLFFSGGRSFRLFCLDMKTGFRYAPETLHKIGVAAAVILVAIWICKTVSKSGFLRVTWKVCVGGHRISIDTNKLPYKHFAILACISFSMLLGSMFIRDTLTQREEEQLESSLVAHALGGIDDKTYTNSREALLYNYGLGHRAFEVDFSITADSKLVCLHDWVYGATMQGRSGDNSILSKDDFEKGVLYGKYTPISLEELLLFMEEHKDVWIVTDSKERDKDLVTFEFQCLVDKSKELGVEQVLDRIVVQIYDEEMYDTVCSIYRFPVFIFTLYQYWNGDMEAFPEICRFCVYNDIDIITMWDYLATPEAISIAEQFGIDIYVHTVNDIEVVRKLQGEGVRGFYTDYLTPEILLSD